MLTNLAIRSITDSAYAAKLTTVRNSAEMCLLPEGPCNYGVIKEDEGPRPAAVHARRATGLLSFQGAAFMALITSSAPHAVRTACTETIPRCKHVHMADRCTKCITHSSLRQRIPGCAHISGSMDHRTTRSRALPPSSWTRTAISVAEIVVLVHATHSGIARQLTEWTSRFDPVVTQVQPT